MGVNVLKPVRAIKQVSGQSKQLLEEQYQLTRSKLDIDMSYMFKYPQQR